MNCPSSTLCRSASAGGACASAPTAAAAHRTYGALGSEVNMAARLMMAAEPGQVLVSETVRHRGDGLFIFRLEPPLRLKGRDEPVTAFSLMDAQPIRGFGAVSNMEVGPMVGRRQRSGQIEAILDMASGWPGSDSSGSGVRPAWASRD